MDFMVKSYIKFSIDIINKPQLIYFSWTLYEKNSLTIIELQIILEILTGDKMAVYSNEKEKIDIMQKDILKLFEE